MENKPIVFKFDRKDFQAAMQSIGFAAPASYETTFDKRTASVVITPDNSAKAIAQMIVAGERGKIRAMVHEANVDRLAGMGSAEQAPAAQHRHRLRTSVSKKQLFAAVGGKVHE